MSMLTGTFGELLFANTADHTTLSSFTTEASLIQGTNQQPIIPAGFFTQPGTGRGKSLLLYASGVFTASATDTLTFRWRIGSTVGATFLTGTLVGVSAAIVPATTTSRWEAILRITCNTPGVGTGNTTLNCDGNITSPGFASPYDYPMYVTAGTPGTWTQTFDASLTYYVNLTCASSVNTNAVTCKRLWCYGEN